MTTTPLFLHDSYLYAITTNIIDIGTDDYGSYFVTDRSIFYPKGGGQLNDKGFIAIEPKNQIEILNARYVDSAIRHYCDENLPSKVLNTQVAMHIFQDIRKQNAAYHTSGHWLAQVVIENLKLPLTPVRADHTPNKAYVQFVGDANCISIDTLDHIKTAMRIDLQANLKIKSELGFPDSNLFASALIPINFKPPVHKPLRFVQIETYAPVPCGGTHVNFLRDITSVQPIEFIIKGNKVLLNYKCQVSQAIAV